MKRKTPRISLPSAVRDYVLDRDRHRCVYCGSDRQLQIDHIVAIANGGSNDLSNLQTLCRICNQRKKAKIDPKSRPKFSL